MAARPTGCSSASELEGIGACRGIVLAVALAIPLWLLAAAIAVPVARGDSVSSLLVLQRAVVGDVNALRQQHGLSQLRTSVTLTAAATAHAREMGNLGYFGHRSADGTDPVVRLRRYYTRPRDRSWSVGENLFWQSASVTRRQVIARWLASPPHRRLLLSPQWREIGASAVRARRAPGVYRGLDVTIVVVDFGARTP